jgi:hypothetical protein
LASPAAPGTPRRLLHYCGIQPVEETMRKTILIACCATLMGIGTAAAQTYGAPAQDATSNSTSMSQHGTSKGKMAKSKTSKHKTVGMSKGSKTTSDSMKQNNMPK